MKALEDLGELVYLILKCLVPAKIWNKVEKRGKIAICLFKILLFIIALLIFSAIIFGLYLLFIIVLEWLHLPADFLF